ncbi:hypothetical protein B5F83_06690 [Muribaculum sp. An289]|uniref:PepSY-associated TM helix domain-containing protein n=1 Tax=unclassified Muribaculum TaxID=2622126 RepID=UPI000B376D64|nr:MULTISPECIES: PepSY-associated TM helix domain-containing protein [unclassified Muribaculum]OUO37040.1 hypothetical protein B5F83_06690 [Muribaculum sp. An289]OUO42531.1 hypothetical protein B5F81_07040 [Muribaculum sp. An287]
MRRFFRKIHLWISVPIGLIISITCLTGAILVFEKEILALAHPHLYRCEVPEGSAMMSGEEIAKALNASGAVVPGADGAPGMPAPDNAVSGADGDRRAEASARAEVAGLPETAGSAGVAKRTEVANVRLPDRENGCAMVTFKGGGRKALSVNPYTGEINGWVERSGFFTAVRQLHRWLMDIPAAKGEKTVGKTIVGISTLLMVVILISGLAIWLPKGSRMLRARLGLSCTKGWKRFLYDSHVSLGFYSLILLLVMALTGLTWSFGWYREAFYAVAGAEPGQLKGLIFSLHTGTWGGIWSKILYFIAALIGGTLPLTGYWLWLRRLKK